LLLPLEVASIDTNVSLEFKEGGEVLRLLKPPEDDLTLEELEAVFAT
jgi:hypothetical protein